MDRLRALGVLALVTNGVYTYWLVQSIDSGFVIWAWLFIIAHTLGTSMLLLFVINNWVRSSLAVVKRRLKVWPKVCILVPTWDEPLEIIERTLHSVLEQEYPPKKLVLVVTDDGHRAELRRLVHQLSQTTKATVVYNRPPRKGTPERDELGEGKAGNLNSALSLVQNDTSISYIETRDCDDLVGDRSFLKYCVGFLHKNPETAYVQTIKDVLTDTKDTFDNHQNAFYRHELRSKHAANAVFPCGSGVVYRKQAVLDIGGFAAWNLVEDFQTGMEILRRGWKSAYMPIVGALGQIAPHDMPNFYKQRSTWTLDSIRLMLFLSKKGLSLRQRLHFMEAATFYLLSWTMLVFALSIAASLVVNDYPFQLTTLGYAMIFWPALLFTQLYVYIARGTPGLRSFMRTYQVFWFSMAFQYLAMSIKALVYGSRRKPRYINTRKVHQFGLYWREVLPQVMVTVILLGVVLHELYFASSVSDVNYFSVGWALFFIFMFAHSLRMAVYGHSFRSRTIKKTTTSRVEKYSSAVINVK